MSDVAFTPRFGRVDPAILPDLPPPMRREAVLLTMERLRTIPDKTVSQSCDPQDERYIRRETQRIFAMRPIDLAELLGETTLTRAPRADEAEETAPRATAQAPASVSDAIVVFAQIRLAADSAASLVVSEAYAAFRAFCAARGHGALPRAQFGAELLQLAKRVDGRREGAVMHGLSLRPSTSIRPMESSS